MKKAFAVFVFILFFQFSFSQKKAPLPPPDLGSASDITSSDKLVENFKIKKEIYNVYLRKERERLDSRQVKGDVFETYKICMNKRIWSLKDFPKYATAQGKIIAEGSYKVENDILTVIEKSYGYIGAYQNTTQYTIDKIGYFKEVSQKTEAIDASTLSDLYVKPAAMNVPLPAKNN